MKFKQKVFSLIDHTFGTDLSTKYQKKTALIEEYLREIDEDMNKPYINHCQQRLNQFKANEQFFDINYSNRMEELIKELRKRPLYEVEKMAKIHRKNNQQPFNQEGKADDDFIKFVKEVDRNVFSY